MAKPSIAEELFNEILTHEGAADTVANLRAFVNSNPPTFETEYLDFKGASVNGASIPDNDAKKTWCEALAGFANTSGGVLVWGLDARKPPGGTVDQVMALGLCLDPNGLRSRLQQLQHQSTDPPIPGVRIEAFPDPGAGNQGFVVCYIPESEYKPHRCETSGKRWVMRVGDSFVDIPVPVLRSLFFPARRSYLVLKAASKTEEQNDVTQGVSSATRFEFSIQNEGPATADQIVIAFKKRENIRFDGYGGMVLPSIPDWRFAYNAPIHPGESLPICRASTRFRMFPQGRYFVTEHKQTVFDAVIFATDQVPQKFILNFTAQDLQQDREVVALPIPLEIGRYS